MMLSISLMSCVWLGVFSTARTGRVMTTATSVLDVVEKLQKEFRGMNQKLDSIKAAQSSCSAVASGSSLELISSKLLTLETKQELTETKLESKLKVAESRLDAVETQLQTTDTALLSTQVLVKSKVDSGSTFVRWGRKSCTNSSHLVYTGVAGGSHYTHTGAAVNLLCLTLTPQFDGTALPKAVNYLYGTEYHDIPNHHDHDVPCSVCRAAQSTTIMVPATHTCPLGWNTQYTGHLVAGHYSHKASTEYNCLDGHPENSRHGHENKDGRLLYYVAASCGSLPCPPYSNGKVVACVVCSI